MKTIHWRGVPGRLVKVLKQEFGLLAQVWLARVIVWRNTSPNGKTTQWQVVSRPGKRYLG